MTGTTEAPAETAPPKSREEEQSQADAQDVGTETDVEPKPTTPPPGSKCLVVLSGGQDSTTCLFVAKQQFEEVHAITFEYGQRHLREIQAATRIASRARVKSHEVIPLGPSVLKGTSPLLQHNTKVGQYASADDLPGGVEPTFVPMRNALFLVIAANRAAVLGITDIFTGVCQEDFGGYPDCRQVFINAFAAMVNEALGTVTESGEPTAATFAIHTPLMDLTKAESVKLAASLPGCFDALAFSHTCYEGKYPPGPHNHASILRAKGFREAGYGDPLIERAKRDGLLPADYPKDGYVAGTKYALK